MGDCLKVDEVASRKKLFKKNWIERHLANRLSLHEDRKFQLTSLLLRRVNVLSTYYFKYVIFDFTSVLIRQILRFIWIL